MVMTGLGYRRAARGATRCAIPAQYTSHTVNGLDNCGEYFVAVQARSARLGSVYHYPGYLGRQYVRVCAQMQIAPDNQLGFGFAQRWETYNVTTDAGMGFSEGRRTGQVHRQLHPCFEDCQKQDFQDLTDYQD